MSSYYCIASWGRECLLFSPKAALSHMLGVASCVWRASCRMVSEASMREAFLFLCIGAGAMKRDAQGAPQAALQVGLSLITTYLLL
eukprot:6477464-Amphidinium_carterae.1